MKSIFAALVLILLITLPISAQLSSTWVIPAVAHAEGLNDTYWLSDVSIHNPHSTTLDIVVHYLPSNEENWSVPTIDIELGAWQTINLWDVLGTDVFDEYGTGALLLYVDLENPCTEPASCDFLANSRTYTIDPYSEDGEFGQTIPGFTITNGTDWWTYGYTTGIINDGWYFRTNIGVFSWSDDWTVVGIDIQDELGNIVATEELDVPPFGHIQQRLDTEIDGATLVYYLIDGPDDALVFPYASVVNEVTGDPSFYFAFASEVGPVVPKRDSTRDGRGLRPVPEIKGDAMTVSPRKKRSPQR